VRISELNWMQLEAYLERDDRIVLPLGTTEQHAYLSLGTDTIVAERLAAEAGAAADVPVLPAMPFGCSPAFVAFPGTPSLRLETLVAVLRDAFDCLHRQGFRRFLVVNGHAGNSPAAAPLADWARSRDGARLLFHDWWTPAPVAAAITAIGPEASHSNWLESFPWTRLPGVDPPVDRKPLVETGLLSDDDPDGNRRLLGDGSYGGLYRRSDDEMSRLWDAAVAGVCRALEDGWG
jgi:creatinine amidohydrolase